MKAVERPILFSAEMVQALRDGRKTQTRRVIRPAPIRVDGGVPYRALPPRLRGVADAAKGVVYPCPYGRAGDRLWVRETFHQAFKRTPNSSGCVYRADDNGRDLNPGWSPNGKGGGWTPSIHMPRWASRITLEVTGVRVENLRSIRGVDAVAEGWPVGINRYAFSAALTWYERLWESINGPGSWLEDPLVWVVEFKLLTRAYA